MQVLVIYSRDLAKASTRYRIVQYEDFLARQGIDLSYIKRSQIKRDSVEDFSRYDLIINQKCLIGTVLSRAILKRSRRILFDFDDAIYTRPGKPYSWFTGTRVRHRLRFWLSHADSVTTPNQRLADYAKRHNKRVTTIPMALDLQHWKPAANANQPKDGIVLGWAGAPVNLFNIERLEPVLKSLLRRYDQIKIAVFCGAKPALSIPYDYHRFVPGQEAEFCRRLDIGLLPLPMDEYAQGKSPIKAIQYLACAVPVVGNISGATKEILNPDNSIAVSNDSEWLDGLERLIAGPALRERMGRAGRQYALKHFDCIDGGRKLLCVIKQLSC